MIKRDCENWKTAYKDIRWRYLEDYLWYFEWREHPSEDPMDYWYERQKKCS